MPYPLWLVPNDEIAFALIRKVASTSIEEAFHYAEVKTPDHVDVIHIPQRVAFIRDPIDRLVSCYSWLFYMFRDSKGKWNFPNANPQDVESYETFVDHIFIADDEHWLPQVQQLTYNGEYLPTNTHPLEQINDVWPIYWEGFFPWCRREMLRPVNRDYRINDLREYYKADFEMREAIS